MPSKRSARSWIDSDDSGAAQGLVDLVVSVGPRLSRDTGEARRADFGRSDGPDESATGTARSRLAGVHGLSQSADELVPVNRRIVLNVEIYVTVERDWHESV